MLVHRQGATAYLHSDSRGDKQRAAIELLKTYPVEPMPCMCGAHEDADILDVDRYGYPITYKLCHNCGLMRADPYFTEESLNKFYAGPYRDLDDNLGTFEDCWEHEYDQGKTLFEKWVPFTGQKIGPRVCEIGCGAGGLLSFLEEQGCEAVGIDSGPIAEYAKEKGLTVREDWPEEEEFDSILLMQVFEHFRDPRAEATKMRKMLKDDGTLLINVPGVFLIPYPYHLDLQRYLILTHPWCYTKDTLAATMLDAGFEMNIGTENVTAIFTKCEPRTPTLKEGLAEDIVKFLIYEEEIFELFKVYSPQIFYAMRTTGLGGQMYDRLIKK